VRPVNLLPQSARPYVASGKAGGGSYIVIAGLAALVLGLAGYVMTTNKITSHKNTIAKAQQETSVANAKVAGLQKYAQFNQVATSRIQSVGSLAVNRIDYERLLRETSRVLPAGVWINSLDAEATGGGAATSSTSSTSGTTATSPTVHFAGCAPTQKSVAATLVRLRAVHGSDDVLLNSSGKGLKLGPAASAGSTSDSGGNCGNNVAFDILVNLSDEVTGFGDLGKKVPADLGGGS
jgi:Tfp pilus assembly protein PilN